MNRIVRVIAGATAAAITASAEAADVDWSKVDREIGKNGSQLPGSVHRYGLPRSDLSVSVDGVAIKPALALGSWVAFQPAPVTAIR